MNVDFLSRGTQVVKPWNLLGCKDHFIKALAIHILFQIWAPKVLEIYNNHVFKVDFPQINISSLCPEFYIIPQTTHEGFLEKWRIFRFK